MSLTRKQIAELLYRQGPVQRFTQDSPVLPDVWLAYAQNPRAAVDLLLTPYQSSGAASLTPGELAVTLQKRLEDKKLARAASFPRASGDGQGAGFHRIAYNQTTVAVRLYFDEIVRVVLPMSGWWAQRVYQAGLWDEFERLGKPPTREVIAELLANGVRQPSGAKKPVTVGPDLLWMIRVVGTIMLLLEAEQQAGGSMPDQEREELLKKAAQPEAGTGRAGGARIKFFESLVSAVARLTSGVKSKGTDRSLVHLVSVNRPAEVSIWRSSVAIKSDAARLLFDVRCHEIAWAVIDSGIDARHPAFRIRGEAPPRKGKKIERGGNGSGRALSLGSGDWSDKTRVVATYDFTVIRDLLSTNVEDPGRLPKSAQRELRKDPDLRRRLRNSLNSGREIDWTLILPLIQVRHDATYQSPSHEHGTHVAGILAADWRPGDDGPDCPVEQPARGVCPDIRLYDLRVLDDEGRGDEFNVMAALQFVRYLNSHKDFMVVHGANLSLSIRHEVMNYACGRTPVCEECERLVGAGITVVAAAGNRGYIPATESNDEAYRTVSITDPGNADGIITVGATHREFPHTYGVSFFSSRGPTGDGRIKPDLVAPGEKIESCVPGGLMKRLDGTSMAAPHVSGAAALLMARHRELIGQPSRIKEILCRTATDLGRERYFQGHGMLDVLRALQFV